MEDRWKNWPLLRISIMTTLPLVIVILFQRLYFQQALAFDRYGCFWFLFGWAYVQLFEYAHHRWSMHTILRVGWLTELFKWIRESHKRHHQIFRTTNFQSTNKEDLRHITGPWWFFPIAFFVHYLILFCFISTNSLNFFAIATVLHYLAYEVPHFLTHKKNNKLDQFLFQIPVLGQLRREQIAYHKRHHDNVKVNFSVTPPFIDAVFRTKARKNPA